MLNILLSFNIIGHIRGRLAALSVSAAIMTAALFLVVPSLHASRSRAMEGPYLGCGAPELVATGFFRTERVGDRWWLVTPDGRRFISRGINHIQYGGYYCPTLGYSPYRRHVEELYGGTAGWAEATMGRLRDWGFNTIGSWSDHEALAGMPYTLTLNLAVLGGGDWRTGLFPDVFDPAWEEAVREHCLALCGPLRDDPLLVGYFTDNELHWGPDWRSLKSLFDMYLELPASSPGGGAARKFLGDGGKHGKAVELEFAQVVAARYFEVTGRAMKDADPNHLNLGCRFHALGVPEGVIEEAGGHVDVISINFYDMMPRLATAIAAGLGNVTMHPDWMGRYSELSGRPVMITEFSYRAADSGLPNTQGAGSVVLTQKQRAERFENYVANILSTPHVVGYHWFNYMDEPWLGRFDGENGNYGVVDGRDRPYEELVDRMSDINAESCRLHQGDR